MDFDNLPPGFRFIEGQHFCVLTNDRDVEIGVYGNRNAPKALVFNHGTPLSGFHLLTADMVRVFRDTCGDDVCILAPTRWGYGTFNESMYRLSIQVHGHINFITRDLDKEIVGIIGHSGGSHISLEMASESGARLIMVAPTCNDDILDPETKAGLKFRSIRDLFINRPRLAWMIAWLHAFLTARGWQGLVKGWAQGADSWINDDPAVYNALYQSARHAAGAQGQGLHFDYLDIVQVWEVAEISNSEFLAFSKDPATPPAMVGALADKVRGQYHSIEGGHFEMWKPGSHVWSTVLRMALR